MDFRAQWNEGEIEAGTLLDEIERLRAEIDNIKQVEFPRKAKAVADNWRGIVERLRTELAEAQAWEKSVQDLVADCLVAASQAIVDRDDIAAQRYLREVLVENAKPRDHSALDALLAPARAEERERCATVASDNYGWNGVTGAYEDSLGDAIRRLS